MCENNKKDGGSEAMASTLNPILSQVPKGASKIFILTPEMLKSLGIADTVGIEKVTGDTAENGEGGTATTGVLSEVLSEGCGPIAQQMAEAKIDKTRKAKKRKRSSVGDKVADKREKNKYSMGSSLEMKQRLNRGKDELFALKECLEDEFSSSRTTKEKKKLNTLKAGINREASEEMARNDTKGETKRDATTRSRTSRVIAKPKKFNDYVVLDNYINGTKRQSCKSNLGIANKELVQSGETGLAFSTRRPTLDSQEILSAHNSPSAVAKTSKDSCILKRSEIVRTYTRCNSKSTKRIVNPPTTEIVSKSEHLETNTNSSSVNICVGSDPSKVQPIKSGILKTYSNRKMTKKMTPESTERLNKSDGGLREIDQPEVCQQKTIEMQASMMSRPQSDSDKSKILNKCDKVAVNNRLQKNEKKKVETGPSNVDIQKLTSQPKIHCARSLSLSIYKNSGAAQTSTDLPPDNMEQARIPKSNLQLKSETEKIPASEADSSQRSWAQESDIPKPLSKVSRSSEICESFDEQLGDTKSILSNDECDTIISEQDTPVFRENNDQSTAFKRKEDSSLESDLTSRHKKANITKQAHLKPPSEMSLQSKAPSMSLDGHPEFTLKTITSSLAHQKGSACDNRTSTPKSHTSNSGDERKATASMLETPMVVVEDIIEITSLENRPTVTEKETKVLNRGAPRAEHTNNASTKVDTLINMDTINVITSKSCTPSLTCRKSSPTVKIATSKSSEKNKSTLLPSVPNSPAKSYNIPIVHDGPGYSEENKEIDLELCASRTTLEGKTIIPELRVCTPPPSCNKQPAECINEGDLEASTADSSISSDKDVVTSERDIPVSCDIHKTILLQPDTSRSSDHSELASKPNVPKPVALQKRKAQFPNENEAAITQLDVLNSPKKIEVSKKNARKSSANKKNCIVKALAKSSIKDDDTEAKTDMANSLNEEKTSKRSVPKLASKNKKSASKKLVLLSDKIEAVEGKLPNKKETLTRDTPKSIKMEVVEILPELSVPKSDESISINTELEIPNVPGRNDDYLSRRDFLDLSSPLHQEGEVSNSTKLDQLESSDPKEEGGLSYPDQNTVKRTSGGPKVITRVADPSTGNTLSSTIATIDSTNFPATNIETQITDQHRTIIEAPSVDVDSKDAPYASIPRKRGRPRRSQEKVNVDAPMTTTNAGMENVNTDDIDTIEISSESRGRMKKPLQRNKDEVEGKGLSEGDSDLDSRTEEIIPARKPGRPHGSITVSKPRGRRRGMGRGRVDREFVPRERSSREQKPETEKSNVVEGQSPGEKTNMDIPPGSEVECAKCKKVMPKMSWPHHNLMTHNDMGWLSDEPKPDFKNDEKLLRTVLSAAARKRRRKICFICEECGDEKRSVNGFISHLQVCGKTEDERDALLVTCEICGNRMMSSSVPSHERFHRQAMNPTKKLATLLAPVTDLSKEKRRAAEKAATKIAKFTDLIKEGEAPTMKRRRTNVELTNMIEKSRDSADPPTRYRGLWKNELSKKGKAACRHPGCDWLGNTMHSMFEHYSSCSCAPRVNFLCKICNFSNADKEEVSKHVRSEHSTEQNKTRKDDSDYECQAHTSDSSEYESEESFDDRSRKSGPTQQRVGIEKEQRSFAGVKFLSAELPMYSKAYFLPAVRWTMEFESKNYRLRLFETLSPNSMRLLSDDEALDYLPKLETSMRIMDTKEQAKKETMESGEKSSDWITWHRFQGRIHNGIPTLFAGGPVWAVAWLTIPAVMYAQEVDQYIAVSTHPTMESTYTVGKSHPEKNLIQIWNLGHLDNRCETVPLVPRFVYGIAHNKGTIWCLEWCPSGCYEYSSFFDAEQTEVHNKSRRRMGLLAAASSDGCVHIFSLPFIDKDSSTGVDQLSDNDFLIYETRPVLTLLISTAMYEKAEQTWQCTKLNWSRELGHDTIIAGFSNGYIALWDLTSKSPLIVTKRGDTTLIEPFQHIYAHGHAVSFVQLIPYGVKRFFVSSSYDRWTKIWDLEDTSYPLSATKRGVTTDGAWLAHWPGFVTAHDDGAVQGSYTYLMLLRQTAVRAVAALPTKSPTYCVGVSDYGNSIAHGTTAGEVLVIFPQHLWNNRELERDIPMRRELATTVEVIDFKKNTAKNENKKSKFNAKNNQKEYTYMPETYDECNSRFGIAFRRTLMRSKDKGLQRRNRPICADRLAEVNVEQYPFTSVNRVSWNPNCWSYLWLCVGYQNGLVRFLHFNAAKLEKEASRLLPAHAESMLAESGGNTVRENEASS